MAWLHTWAGLLPGWLLFVVFLFGTIAFFQIEIDGWMHPEVRRAPVTAQALDRADAILRARASGADSWSLSLPSGRSNEALALSWTPKGGNWKDRIEVKLDPATGREVAVRESGGGFFLYRLHFDLHYMPVMWARYLVCIAALSMLVAILSGVVTHKKIFADFFTLRFGKGQRSWLDTHNVTAVLALPFHLMITYTGLVTLLFMLMPWGATAAFGSMDAYYEKAFPPSPVAVSAAPSSDPAPQPVPMREIIARAETNWGGQKANYVSIQNPGTRDMAVSIWPGQEALGGKRQAVYLDGATGEILGTDGEPGSARATQQVMIDLHTGRFSGTTLRWLYFFSGVAGTIMVASGLVLWTVKRRSKLPDPSRPYVGFALVERLNIGVIAGSCAGTAVYFLANRLLPVELQHRADWEINCLFIAWGAVFTWSIARPLRQAWVEALAACAGLYALVPVANALMTPRGLVPSLIGGDWIFAGFDLAMLVTAAACGFTAWKLATRKAKPVPRRKTPKLEAVAA
ncbi:putative iron-regulated membrane protein [Sphingobium sp. B11D3B]|uniref:PepSY-associated TM helix domain-containing protein n=1 Tax=Sphingobium sp. B11D3B TaxID=2940575 RepID=UPI0022264722|nr:PepSY-associated TM helix domain-containing protein [Sphingobium sp. B11D3B]MCW2389646.1 putative iron-regulated membrane protein [Sphingobium sp. B11D3B]